MIGWWDTALYCTPDAQSLREAEERAERELFAQSRVVSRAKVDRSAFWQRIDARRRETPAGVQHGG